MHFHFSVSLPVYCLLSCECNFWPWPSNLTQMGSCRSTVNKYLDQWLFHLKVIIWTHTQLTSCSTWTTKVASKNSVVQSLALDLDAELIRRIAEETYDVAHVIYTGSVSDTVAPCQRQLQKTRFAAPAAKILSSNPLLHCVSKKQDTKLLPITSPNVNRFSKFFHWLTHW